MDWVGVAGLLNRDAPSRWANLGLWSGAHDYPGAARGLALRLGASAGLAPGQRVLDLGVGCGDQLSVWADFGVAHVDACEPDDAARERAFAHVSREGLGDRVALHAVGAEAVGRLAPARYDRVLALDCAYQFPAVALERAVARLRPGGRLALTDLLLGSAAPRRVVSAVAPAFGISRAHLCPAGVYRSRLAGLGLVDVHIQRLTDDVLGGFARHAPGLAAGSPRSRALPVRITAAAAGFAARRRWLDYVLVSAERPRD